ncbi:carboxypeptidase regulatory-like domain-containing protein [Gemmatimonas sp.]|uniref:MSCRAMM family protein n=1 Tax=Gemmatimonas sp. TaxID=1962908 RepID=UPI003341D93E
MRSLIGPAAAGLVVAGLLAHAAQAQPMYAAHTGVPPVRTPQGMRVTGQVHDSITGFPLRRAVVQLVDLSGYEGGRMALTDSLGHYAFTDVPTGRYTLGFHHTVLDSLGLEPLTRTIDVARNLDAADLAVPSAVGIRAAVCGAPSANNPGTLLMGFVRDAATGDALPNATVTVEWLEYELAKGRMAPRIVRRRTTAGSNGWYGVCNIPREGFVQVAARSNSDSTDHVEFEVAADALQRRELFVGRSITTTTTSSGTGDSAVVRVLRTGSTRFAGVVRRDGNGRPLENATVQIVNGPTTRTNAKGEFFFDNAPAGTRLLDVRAVGFYPQRTTVNVLDDAPAFNASLRTFRSVLDTVKVLANYERFSLLKEFQQRVRSGVGRYITEEMIARRNPVMVSELFWIIPGVYVERGGGIDQEISMRGIFSPRCSPALFLNGFPLQMPDMGGVPLSAAELDAVVRPKDLLGVEIYTQGQVPAQFGAGMTGCGAIAFWTK